MQKTFRAISVGFAIAGLTACASVPSAHQSAPWSILSEETTQTVHEIISRTATEQGIAGYSIGLLRDGQVVYKTHGGFANIEHQVAISPDSRYQLYSASKLFFNVALLQLVERGELDPDASLGLYLPDLPDAWATLTVRQTWSHMTGTTDILDLNGMEETAKEALESVMDVPFKFTPGHETEYNQTNFLLLRNVFETITGTTYQDYLEDALLAPISIDRIPLGDLTLVAPNLTTNYESHAYEAGQLGRRSFTFPPYIYTSAGINITLDEFALWWQAVLGETFIKEETLRKSWEPVLRHDGSPSSRSYGWEREHRDGVLRIGHGGGGRVHLYHYVPDTDTESSVTVIFLNNGGAEYFDHRRFGDSLANAILIQNGE